MTRDRGDPGRLSGLRQSLETYTRRLGTAADTASVSSVIRFRVLFATSTTARLCRDTVGWLQSVRTHLGHWSSTSDTVRLLSMVAAWSESSRTRSVLRSVTFGAEGRRPPIMIDLRNSVTFGVLFALLEPVIDRLRLGVDDSFVCRIVRGLAAAAVRMGTRYGRLLTLRPPVTLSGTQQTDEEAVERSASEDDVKPRPGH